MLGTNSENQMPILVSADPYIAELRRGERQRMAPNFGKDEFLSSKLRRQVVGTIGSIAKKREMNTLSSTVQAAPILGKGVDTLLASFSRSSESSSDSDSDSDEFVDDMPVAELSDTDFDFDYSDAESVPVATPVSDEEDMNRKIRELFPEPETEPEPVLPPRKNLVTTEAEAEAEAEAGMMYSQEDMKREVDSPDPRKNLDALVANTRENPRMGYCMAKCRGADWCDSKHAKLLQPVRVVSRGNQLSSWITYLKGNVEFMFDPSVLQRAKEDNDFIVLCEKHAAEFEESFRLSKLKMAVASVPLVASAAMLPGVGVPAALQNIAGAAYAKATLPSAASLAKSAAVNAGIKVLSPKGRTGIKQWWTREVKGKTAKQKAAAFGYLAAKGTADLGKSIAVNAAAGAAMGATTAAASELLSPLASSLGSIGTMASLPQQVKLAIKMRVKGNIMKQFGVDGLAKDIVLGTNILEDAANMPSISSLSTLSTKDPKQMLMTTGSALLNSAKGIAMYNASNKVLDLLGSEEERDKLVDNIQNPDVVGTAKTILKKGALTLAYSPLAAAMQVAGMKSAELGDAAYLVQEKIKRQVTGDLLSKYGFDSDAWYTATGAASEVAYDAQRLDAEKKAMRRAMEEVEEEKLARDAAEEMAMDKAREFTATKLREAVQTGDLSTFKGMLKSGVDPNLATNEIMSASEEFVAAAVEADEKQKEAARKSEFVDLMESMSSAPAKDETAASREGDDADDLMQPMSSAPAKDESAETREVVGADVREKAARKRRFIDLMESMRNAPPKEADASNVSDTNPKASSQQSFKLAPLSKVLGEHIDMDGDKKLSTQEALVFADQFARHARHIPTTRDAIQSGDFDKFHKASTYISAPTWFKRSRPNGLSKKQYMKQLFDEVHSQIKKRGSSEL